MTRVVVIEGEPDAKCEQCGKIDELRPYGRRLESGRRMRICYDCAKKEAARAFAELIEGDEA